MPQVRFKIECLKCGSTCWVDGYEERDTNFACVSENDPLEDACEHLKEGEDYEIIDSEYPQSEGDYE